MASFPVRRLLDKNLQTTHVCAGNWGWSGSSGEQNKGRVPGNSGRVFPCLLDALVWASSRQPICQVAIALRASSWPIVEIVEQSNENQTYETLAVRKTCSRWTINFLGTVADSAASLLPEGISGGIIACCACAFKTRDSSYAGAQPDATFLYLIFFFTDAWFDNELDPRGGSEDGLVRSSLLI